MPDCLLPAQAGSRIRLPYEGRLGQGWLQAEQPSREAEDAAERVRAVQRRLADARRDSERSHLRAEWLEHQLSEAVARADAAEQCAAHLQDRTRYACQACQSRVGL